MKKIRSCFASLGLALALAVSGIGSSAVVQADALRVVTLGADLSKDQQQKMLNYFKVNADEVRIIYVTNADERARLGSYVPLEQIGTRTVSCAYVRPTTSGGIKVRTANLNWVTGNMIASSMATSGVKNCEIIAACPFEVSGTGALTGVQMAYESASGQSLDETKKQVANEELVVTGNLANEVGSDQAVSIINQLKMEVIGNDIQEADQINNVVNNVVNNVTNNNGIQLTPEQVQQLTDLLSDIAAQNYDYDDMEETLLMIDSNVAGALEGEIDEAEASLNPETAKDSGKTVDGGIESAEEELSEGEADAEAGTYAETLEAEEVDEESILFDLDEGILGEDVITSATDESLLNPDSTAGTGENAEDEWYTMTENPEFGEAGEADVVDMTPSQDPNGQTAEPAEDEWEVYDTGEGLEEQPEGEALPAEDSKSGSAEDDWFMEEEGEDAQWDETADSEAEGAESAQPQEGGAASKAFDAAAADLSAFDSVGTQNYSKALHFCLVEYQGQSAASYPDLSMPAGSGTVYLDAQTGKALTDKVMQEYYNIVKSGGEGFSLSFADEYASSELNQMAKSLKKIFGKETGLFASSTPDSILANTPQADCDTLYQDTLTFFEALYGESSSVIIDSQSGKAGADPSGSQTGSSSGAAQTGSTYGTDPYGETGSAADPYAANPDGTDTYGTDTYGTDTYGTDTYGTDTYGTDETGAEDSGYGYETDQSADGTDTYGGETYGDTYAEDDLEVDGAEGEWEVY